MGKQPGLHLGPIRYELLSSMTLLVFLATEQAVTKKWALCLFYFIVKNLSGR